MEQAVIEGLARPQKSLPPWLFYDREGSELFEQITTLPEYYPTRTELEIFHRNADEIITLARGNQPLTVIELGAGTATKTRVLLDALSRLQGGCVYVPVDVSASALEEAERSIKQQLRDVCVRPIVRSTEEALGQIRAITGRKLLLFIGSSIGNYEDASAQALLTNIRESLGSGDSLLLGTDLRKDLSILLPAYDDAAAVTAKFNKNVLIRLNRELRANFDPTHFEHLIRWNEKFSRIEMHLLSTRTQTVTMAGISLTFSFRQGETIHTESSVKYDKIMVERLLTAAGFVRECTFEDARSWFAVHLARA